MSDRTCVHCGQTFNGKRRDSRHCSKVCQRRWFAAEYHRRQRNTPARACPACDTPIPAEAHLNRVYCSVSCRNVARTTAQYGLTIADYRAMLDGQGHRCAICGGADLWKLGVRDNGWHIDHDHGTGRVRGVLCPACNLMLGYASDDPGVLRRAADYIEQNRP